MCRDNRQAHHALKSQAHHSIMYESSTYSNRCAVRAGMMISSFASYSVTVSLPVMTSYSHRDRGLDLPCKRSRTNHRCGEIARAHKLAQSAAPSQGDVELRAVVHVAAPHRACRAQHLAVGNR